MATEKSQLTKDGSQFCKPNFAPKKPLHWKHARQHRKTCRPHHLHIQGTPTKLTKPFRLTSLMNCQRLEAYACRPKFVSTQSLVKKSMFRKRDFDDFQFQEPQMDFLSTPVLVLHHPPLPSFYSSKWTLAEKHSAFPRFNCQSIQTGSFVLTIFHVCRPHLHSCLGSWHLPTMKRQIHSFFSWWFTYWSGEIFHWSSKVLKVTRW